MSRAKRRKLEQLTTALPRDTCVYIVAESPGEPFYIARLMEYVQDRVRVNWFYRSRDVQKQSSDSRLLYATMHSDIVPTASLRGICDVRYRSQVEDEDVFRNKPDSFYFDRLFDKFMHRYYDLLPTQQVSNVPEEIAATLRERWRFVAVEVGHAKEMTMERKNCCKCQEWCSPRNGIRCESCGEDYHLQCLDPPLPKRPSRGFVWTCVRCTAHVASPSEADVSSEDTIRNDDGKHPPASCNTEIDIRGVRSPTAANDVLTQDGLQLHELWPYRYLGLHCSLRNALDVHDRIHPRAATRIGPRYQTAVFETHNDLSERGTDATSVCMFDPEKMPDDFLERCIDMARPKGIETASTDFVEYSFALLSEHGGDSGRALDHLKRAKKQDIMGTPWNNRELSKYAEAVALYGADLHEVARAVATKSTGECVRRYYAQQETAHHEDSGHVESGEEEMYADPDDASLFDIGRVSDAKKIFICGFCSTSDSHSWHRAPNQHTQGDKIEALCERCADLWRRYAVQWEIVDSTKRANDARRHKLIEPMLLRNQERSVSTSALQQKKRKSLAVNVREKCDAQQTSLVIPCAVCRGAADLPKIVCTRCAISVHRICSGVAKETLNDEWKCEVCRTDRLHEASGIRQCVLCPVTCVVDPAIKRTTGGNWAHIVCATFNLDLAWFCANIMDRIEGIASLPAIYWKTPCKFCASLHGASVACSHCGAAMHVGCARSNGATLAFEVQSRKSHMSRALNGSCLKIDPSLNTVHPHVICAEHDVGHLGLHPIDTRCGEHDTLLSFYVQEFQRGGQLKGSNALGTYGLSTDDWCREDILRHKRIELDNGVARPTLPVDPSDTRPDQGCRICLIDTSPAWYDTVDGCLCHLCHRRWAKTEP
ncbi:putative PHD type zinc finger protein with BAH domain-containing protein [Savitreella phatthalungensis]